MITNYEELETKLAAEADDVYSEFTKKAIPSDRPFIGVRIPKIREIVSQISPEKIEELIDAEPIAIEEVLARGILIHRLSYEKMLSYFDSQIAYINDWCTCDIFCSGLRKTIRGHHAELFDQKIEKLLKSNQEYPVRVGLVLLKCYYVDYDYLNVIFDRVENLAKRQEYYIKMAIAWLIAECFIKYPEETFAYLKATKLPKWTFNKTISKICDSYRVAPEVKETLRKMRK